MSQSSIIVGNQAGEEILSDSDAEFVQVQVPPVEDDNSLAEAKKMIEYYKCKYQIEKTKNEEAVREMDDLENFFAKKAVEDTMRIVELEDMLSERVFRHTTDMTGAKNSISIYQEMFSDLEKEFKFFHKNATRREEELKAVLASSEEMMRKYIENQRSIGTSESLDNDSKDEASENSDESRSEDGLSFGGWQENVVERPEENRDVDDNDGAPPMANPFFPHLHPSESAFSKYLNDYRKRQQHQMEQLINIVDQIPSPDPGSPSYNAEVGVETIIPITIHNSDNSSSSGIAFAYDNDPEVLRLAASSNWYNE